MKAMTRFRPLLVSLTALAVLAGAAAPASAQYFGQNKVQYRQRTRASRRRSITSFAAGSR